VGAILSDHRARFTIHRHSFGGVEHKAFPDVVTDLKDPNNALTVSHFDSTFDFFDNNVSVPAFKLSLVRALTFL
jgi:hypothetical protein